MAWYNLRKSVLIIWGYLCVTNHFTQMFSQMEKPTDEYRK